MAGDPINRRKALMFIGGCLNLAGTGAVVKTTISIAKAATRQPQPQPQKRSPELLDIDHYADWLVAPVIENWNKFQAGEISLAQLREEMLPGWQQSPWSITTAEVEAGVRRPRVQELVFLKLSVNMLGVAGDDPGFAAFCFANSPMGWREGGRVERTHVEVSPLGSEVIWTTAAEDLLKVTTGALATLNAINKLDLPDRLPYRGAPGQISKAPLLSPDQNSDEIQARGPGPGPGI